ncbi:MAG: hypothetical protein ACNA8W_02525 [Bradymonadaceae bacterium]
MWAWLTFLGALIIVGLLLWTGIRFVRGRRGDIARGELIAALDTMAARLGLAPVLESSVYGAQIITLEGVLNGFRIHLEIWNHPRHCFSRLTLMFPRSLRQGLRILEGKRVGILHRAMGMQPVELGITSKDTQLVVLSGSDSETHQGILTAELEGLLLGFGSSYDEIQLNDENLFILERKILEASEYERLVRAGLRLVTLLYQRAREVGPTTTRRTTNYARAESEMFNRSSSQVMGDEPVSSPSPSVETEETSSVSS